MMGWPADSRVDEALEAPPLDLRTRRKRRKTSHDSWNYPTVFPISRGAVILSRTKVGLDWAYAAELSAGKQTPILIVIFIPLELI